MEKNQKIQSPKKNQISQIYRRRIIPAECILLKDDIIVSQNDEAIITKWNTLNPKLSFSHGSSCYFLKEGIKMNKFYRDDDTLLFWYCDIVEYALSPEGHALTVTDLLADVVVHPDGKVEVLDLDELAEALEQDLITEKQAASCLRSLNRLLSLIYGGGFGGMQARLDGIGL